MNTFCPNLRNPQVKQDFNQLIDMVGEDIAYYLWNKYEGDMSLALPRALDILSLMNSETPKNNKQDIRRRKNFTAVEFAASSRLSSLLRELFPEISVEYVDGIEDGHVGKAEYESLKILVDMFESTSDTEPHEYAHFYIEMFKNSELVQNGIKEFGSKEKLVQAVGVRTVEMDGKARTWWLKFKDFIKKLLNKNKYAKEALLAELTDAFLTRSDIGEGVSIYDLLGVDYQSAPDIQTVRALLKLKAASIVYDKDKHSYVDKATGKVMRAVTKWLEVLKMSSYDADSADEIQKEINNEASEGGSRIHAVMESLWLGTFKESDYLDFFSKEALLDLKDVYKQLSKLYDFVAAEAMLSDVEHEVAGTADLLVKDKSTGKYILLDYKSKMFKYNDKTENKKGKRLWGFFWATSKNLSTVSLRDKYDAQLSIYKKLLNDMGIPVEEHGVIPLVYAVNGKKITKIMISKQFGGDESNYNKNLKSRRFVQLLTPDSIKYDIDYGIFKEKTNDEKDELRQKMIQDLRTTFSKVVKLLNVQKDILRARGRRSRSSEAGYILGQFEDVSEIEALFKYTKFGEEQLVSIQKHLKLLISQGKNATWDMATLQEYKDVASSYQVVGEISADIQRYSLFLSSETVNEMLAHCHKLQQAQLYIISECNNKLAEMYIEDVKRYVKNIEMNYRDKYDAEFRKDNPRQPSESKSKYKARKQVYIDKKIEENREQIDAETKAFLIEQTDTANAGFEVTGLFAAVNSALESPDPFVQYSMMKYWEVIRKRDKQFLNFLAKLQKILKEYRNKYGYSNYQNDKEYFEDLIEITENGCYLVSPWGAEFLEAMDKAFTEIRESDMSSIEKEEARLQWMNKHFPISDQTAYDNEYNAAVKEYFKNMDKDKSLKKQWDVIQKNSKLDISKRLTLWQLLGKGEITGDVYNFLNDLRSELDEKYRVANSKIYPNTKYHKLLQLRDLNDPKWKLYELFKSTSEDIDGRMGHHKLKLSYRLPGVVKRGREVVGRDGIKKAISAHIQRESIIMPDEVLRGSYVNASGVKIDMIPLPFKKKLNEEEQSFDLPTVYAMWYSAATEFLGKREIESLMLETSRVLTERLTETNKRSLLAKNKTETAKEKKENTKKQFQSWLDIVFYGNRLEDYGTLDLPWSDKLVDVAKLINAFVEWQNTRVMAGNFTSWINNLLVGEVNQIEDVLAGRHLTKRAYHKASEILIKNTPDMISDINRIVPKNKYNRLADYFGLFADSKNQSITGFLRHSFLDGIHVGQAIGDRILQLRLLFGLLCEMQAIDKDGNVLGDMLDFIDVNDDMELVVDPKVSNFNLSDVDKFSLAVEIIKLRTHGNYSAHWAVAISKTWYGKIGLSLRNWIASTVERRFGREQTNSITNERFRGFYRTFFKWMFTQTPFATSIINFIAANIKNGEKLKRLAVKWDLLPERDKQDIISAATELSFACLAYVLYCILDNGDDDDDNDALAMLKYQSYRLYTDLTFYLLPTSFSKILQDPFPTMTLLTDINNVFILIASPMEKYNSGNHMFDNKLLDKTVKLMPLFKQVHRVDNISAEMEYFIRKT